MPGTRCGFWCHLGPLGPLPLIFRAADADRPWPEHHGDFGPCRAFQSGCSNRLVDAALGERRVAQPARRAPHARFLAFRSPSAKRWYRSSRRKLHHRRARRRAEHRLRPLPGRSDVERLAALAGRLTLNPSLDRPDRGEPVLVLASARLHLQFPRPPNRQHPKSRSSPTLADDTQFGADERAALPSSIRRSGSRSPACRPHQPQPGDRRPPSRPGADLPRFAASRKASCSCSWPGWALASARPGGVAPPMR